MLRRFFFPEDRSPVFWLSAGLVLLLVLYSILAQDSAQQFFGDVQKWIVVNVSWFYILAVAIILLSVIFLAFSRFGDIRLGPDHSRPDYRNTTWFAMLFSTGMGIGLVFFGVAEPLMHYNQPPLGDPQTIQAAREAMKLTFFHWGLHAWAIYAIVGLILAFFSFRHGLPLSLRSSLYPIIGKRIYGPIGHAVDTFAIIGTIFGVATSLGYGVAQINAGLNYLFQIPVSSTVQIILICIATALATFSAASGLNKGIRILSEFNLLLAVLMLLAVLCLGPTVFLLKTLMQNTGAYLSSIVSKTFYLYAYQPTDWIGGWTLLYWGWWLSWSPFVGLFIARISRGRTIREFVLGVLLIPTGFTLLWMSFFGDAAIHMVIYENADHLIQIAQEDSALVLFAFFEYLPFSSFLSVMAIFMVLVFFITSADSGALVVGMLASGGKTLTSLSQRIFWSVMIGVVAAALLLAGGLKSMQAATIASAFPFSIILLIAMWGLFKALHIDATKRQVLSAPGNSGQQGGDWRRRLRVLLMLPKRAQVVRYIQEVVTPACTMAAEEWRKQGYEVDISYGDNNSCKLWVSHGKEIDFTYEVRPRAYTQPSFSMDDLESAGQENKKYFRAEVYLNEGGQNYDVMGWSKEDIIADLINQYERHLHFLHVVRPG